MLKLTMKDFVLQKKTVFYLGVFVLVFSIFISSQKNFTNKEIIIAQIVLALVYNFFNRAVYSDERNNSLRLLTSLPVQRRTIVYSKYLSVLIFTIAASVLYFCIVFCINYYTRGALGRSAAFTFLFFIVAVVIFSLYLPLAYKFGYAKSMWASMAIVMVGMFGVAGSSIVGMFMKGTAGMEPQTMDMLMLLSNPVEITILIAAVAAVYLVSAKVAAGLFDKRSLF